MFTTSSLRRCLLVRFHQSQPRSRPNWSYFRHWSSQASLWSDLLLQRDSLNALGTRTVSFSAATTPLLCGHPSPAACRTMFSLALALWKILAADQHCRTFNSRHSGLVSPRKWMSTCSARLIRHCHRSCWASSHRMVVWTAISSRCDGRSSMTVWRTLDWLLSPTALMVILRTSQLCNGASTLPHLRAMLLLLLLLLSQHTIYSHEPACFLSPFQISVALAQPVLALPRAQCHSCARMERQSSVYSQIFTSRTLLTLAQSSACDCLAVLGTVFVLAAELFRQRSFTRRLVATICYQKRDLACGVTIWIRSEIRWMFLLSFALSAMMFSSTCAFWTLASLQRHRLLRQSLHRPKPQLAIRDRLLRAFLTLGD